MVVKLFCVLVGVAGSAFPVDINPGRSVGHLEDEIKEEKLIIGSCSKFWYEDAQLLKRNVTNRVAYPFTAI
nr:Crinkler effector protein 1 [Phytophthora ramorum]